jgi:hypothetical protein
MKSGKIVEMGNPRTLKDSYGVQTMQDVFLACVQREVA